MNRMLDPPTRRTGLFNPQLEPAAPQHHDHHKSGRMELYPPQPDVVTPAVLRRYTTLVLARDISDRIMHLELYFQGVAPG